MLARPAAGKDGEPDALRHGFVCVVVLSVVVVVSVVVPVSAGGGGVTSGGGTYVPTVSVTSDLGSACAFPAGAWDITSPSSDGSSVSCLTTVTLKPAALSVARASGAVWSETSGTVTVVGPFETDSVTGEPFEAVELPGGL